MEVLEAIRTKRSIRQFDPKPLPQTAIQTILNAGRRAQSSKNTQPWQFIAVTDREMLQKMSQLGDFAQHLAGAALGVVILTPNPDQRWSIMFDAGQAAAYMQLAAWDLGIGSVIAAIYHPDKARELLGFPADLYANAALSFGYPVEAGMLTGRPKSGGRKPLEEMVHWDRW